MSEAGRRLINAVRSLAACDHYWLVARPESVSTANTSAALCQCKWCGVCLWDNGSERAVREKEPADG